MTQHLATKQDLAHTNALMAKSFEAVNQRFESVDKRFEVLEKSLDVRFSTFEAKFDSRLDQQETRIVKKLGGIMAFLFAAIAGLQAFLR